MQILSRRTKNNPALIGEPGVGKTAIVEGLAQRIIAGDVPETLAGQARACPRYRRAGRGHQVPRRVRRAPEEDRRRNQGHRRILFIDELHTLVGAGAAEGAVDAANILKPALSRGELQTIGATTLDEYRKYIERDAALERRFQPVRWTSRASKRRSRSCAASVSCYEEHHHLKITDEALKAAANLAARYVTDRFMPDKAIDLIDEAARACACTARPAPPTCARRMQELEAICTRKRRAGGPTEDFEPAADCASASASCASASATMEEGCQAEKTRRRCPTSPKRTSPRSSRCGPASR